MSVGASGCISNSICYEQNKMQICLGVCAMLSLLYKHGSLCAFYVRARAITSCYRWRLVIHEMRRLTQIQGRRDNFERETQRRHHREQHKRLCAAALHYLVWMRQSIGMVWVCTCTLFKARASRAGNWRRRRTWEIVTSFLASGVWKLFLFFSLFYWCIFFELVPPRV